MRKSDSDDGGVGPAIEEEEGEAQHARDAKKDGSQDEWMDVLGSGKLLKKEVRAGKGRDTRPSRGQLARYTLRVSVNGEPVDANADGTSSPPPREAIVGENDDALALDLVLPLMELGEVCEVKTTPRYDNRPVPSSDAEIAYVVELLDVVDVPPLKDMPRELRFARASMKKERANELHVRELYEDSCGQLRRALSYLTAEGTLASEEESLVVVCWTNLAAGLLKLENYREAIKACDSALDLQSGNEKALFRKAKALTEIKAYEDAQKCLDTLLSAAPKNVAAARFLREVRQKLREAKDAERMLARKMVTALDGTSEDATRIHEEQQKRLKLEASRKKSEGWWEWASWAAIVVAVVVVMVIAAISVHQAMNVSSGPRQASMYAGHEASHDAALDNWEETDEL